MASHASGERLQQAQLLLAAVMDGHGSGRGDHGRPGAIASTYVAHTLPDTVAQLMKEGLRMKQQGAHG